MVVYGRNAQATRALFDFLRALGLQPLEWDQLVAAMDTATPYVGEFLIAPLRPSRRW